MFSYLSFINYRAWSSTDDNNKMIRKTVTAFLRPTYLTRFSFSGGDHHEIDYHAVVTKN